MDAAEGAGGGPMGDPTRILVTLRRRGAAGRVPQDPDVLRVPPVARPDYESGSPCASTSL
ncbi:hypothetical protein GCM10010365_47310 [Streptomyces poonensis]|uniref:Uncharacterized protein n=1 Tax=Streptomyces poonensis TaxID=68255 RepID=A0A918PT07_9ACTN|nr:hypothetical protein GCM10010365_47310 [Streptomyces poonensis]GLJ93474.1 hypothetical protein GCM10017589_60870 [Streptomyces poonensis]